MCIEDLRLPHLILYKRLFRHKYLCGSICANITGDIACMMVIMHDREETSLLRAAHEDQDPTKISYDGSQRIAAPHVS